MADYSEYSAQVGLLKQAAIDAYMCQGNNFTRLWRLGENEYHEGAIQQNHDGGISLIPPATVTRPGPDGEGGGEVTKGFSTVSTYVGDFATIRQNISAALEGWDQLPDPDNLSGAIEKLSKAARLVQFDEGTTESDIPSSGSSLADKFELIESNLLGLDSLTLDAFLENFLKNLKRVARNLGSATAVLYGAALAEQRLWEAARVDVMEVIVKAREVFSDVATSTEGDREILFFLLGLVTDVAGIFPVGKVASAVIKGASVTVSTVETAVGALGNAAPAENILGSSYAEALNAFLNTMKNLRETVAKVEQSIQHAVIGALGELASDRASFDATLDPSHSELEAPSGSPDELSGSGDVLNVLNLEEAGPKISNVVDTHLPGIKAELDDASQLVNSATMGGIVDRPATIGVGATGPSADFDAMISIVSSLITDAGWDAERAADLLDLAWREIQGVDGDYAGQFAEFSETVDVGSGQNPYDFGGSNPDEDPFSPYR